MYKKLIMFIVILSLALTFSGCNKNSPLAPSPTAISETRKTGKEVVKLLNAKTDTTEKTEFDTDYTMDMTMATTGLTMDVKVSGNMKFKYVNDNPQYYMTMKTNMLGIDSNILMVMADGKAYYEVDGEKIEMETADMQAEFNKSVNSNLSEDAVKSYTTSKDGDNTVYDIVIDTDKLDGLVASLLDDASTSGSAKFDKCKAIITVDSNNNPVNYEMLVKFNITVDEQTMSYDTKMTMKFNSFKDIEIDLSKLQAE